MAAADALRDLHLDRGAFDLVACQVRRDVLPRQGGRVRRGVASTRTRWPFPVQHMDVIETNDVVAVLAEAVAKTFPDDPPQFLTRVPHGYADVDRLRARRRGRGAQIEQLETVTLTGHAESARQLATGFCYGTPCASPSKSEERSSRWPTPSGRQ